MDTTPEKALPDHVLRLQKAALAAFNTDDYERAANLYEQLTVMLPNDWEAFFYASYCKAMNCKIAQIASACNQMRRVIPQTLTMLRTQCHVEGRTPAEKEGYLDEIADCVETLALSMAHSATSFYNKVDSNVRNRFLADYRDQYKSAILLLLESGQAICRINNFHKNCPAIGTKLLRAAFLELEESNFAFYDDLSSATSLLRTYDPAFLEDYNSRRNAVAYKKARKNIVTLSIVWPLLDAAFLALLWFALEARSLDQFLNMSNIARIMVPIILYLLILSGRYFLSLLSFLNMRDWLDQCIALEKTRGSSWGKNYASITYTFAALAYWAYIIYFFLNRIFPFRTMERLLSTLQNIPFVTWLILAGTIFYAVFLTRQAIKYLKQAFSKK